MSKRYYSLEFAQFPRVWGIINIPKDVVVYRSGTKAPLLSTDPRFFSDFYTAKAYKDMIPTYNTYACCTNELKLMDLRTLRYLFLEYVGHNRLLFEEAELNIITKALFALGLMSTTEQIEFIKDNVYTYPNLERWEGQDIQQVAKMVKCVLTRGSYPANKNLAIDRSVEYYQRFGGRISDSSIDDEVVALLKQLFSDVIDGYIAPTLDSVWHDFGFNPELCLFDPSKSLSFCTEVPSTVMNPDLFVPPVNISLIVNGTYTQITGRDYIKGGGNGNANTNKQYEDNSCISKRPKLTEDSNFANEKSTIEVNKKVQNIWKSYATTVNQKPAAIQSTESVTVPIRNENNPLFGNRITNSGNSNTKRNGTVGLDNY